MKVYLHKLNQISKLDLARPEQFGPLKGNRRYSLKVS